MVIPYLHLDLFTSNLQVTHVNSFIKLTCSFINYFIQSLHRIKVSLLSEFTCLTFSPRFTAPIHFSENLLENIYNS